MNAKVIVAYEHQESATGRIDLAVIRHGAKPGEDDWKPALRDIVDGERVVWARFEASERSTDVWLRDGEGSRRVRPI